MRKATMIIVDNFYENPWQVREEAMKKEYTLPGAFPYPGVISTNESEMTDWANKKIGEILEINPDHILKRSHYGCYRMISEGNIPQVYIHTHRLRWTGLVYLNPPADCQGGLKFYRSKKFGAYYGYQDELKYLETQELTESKDLKWQQEELETEDGWEMTGFVGMAFNRLVLFNASLFHSFTPGFGNSVETNRMTQNFDFDIHAN